MPANSTQLQYTTNKCRKCNSTKYKGCKFKSNYHQVGLITMLILKVLLLTIIMAASELTLKKKFDLDEIIFRTIKHPIPYYDYVVPLFDAQFGNKSVLKEDLVNEGIIVDNSGYKKYYDDDVDRLQNFITAHVKSIVSSDGDDCQQKMNKVVLKTICKTCYLVLTNAK